MAKKNSDPPPKNPSKTGLLIKKAKTKVTPSVTARPALKVIKNNKKK